MGTTLSEMIYRNDQFHVELKLASCEKVRCSLKIVFSYFLSFISIVHATFLKNVKYPFKPSGSPVLLTSAYAGIAWSALHPVTLSVG